MVPYQHRSKRGPHDIEDDVFVWLQGLDVSPIYTVQQFPTEAENYPALTRRKNHLLEPIVFTSRDIWRKQLGVRKFVSTR
jgi:hypothetical protein